MLKQSILILLLSAVTIVFKAQLGQLLDGFVYLHNSIAAALHVVFSDDQVGSLIQDMISLLVIPLFCGLLVATVFWLVKRAQMPHIMAVIWVVWLMLLITMVSQSGVISKKMVNQSNTNLALHATYTATE